MTQLQKQTPVCAECGSSDMEAHGMLSWSKEIQDWQIAETFERCNCNNCGNTDSPIKWINEDTENLTEEARDKLTRSAR